MTIAPVWWDLAPNHGVLELDHGLELHVVRSNRTSIAWWLTDRGWWLRVAPVGVA